MASSWIVPSTEKVAVDAVTPGLTGNVAANAIVIVPKGENANRTAVTNEVATTGGTHTETKQVVQADLDAAMTALNDKLPSGVR